MKRIIRKLIRLIFKKLQKKKQPGVKATQSIVIIINKD